MRQRRHLSESETWKVVGLLDGGKTQVEVAKAIGVAQSVISRVWNRFLETGYPGQKSGQERATMPNEDRYLKLTSQRHRNMNAFLLQQQLHLANGTTVSTETVRLHALGFYASD